MSQHDLNIANQGFPAFRSDLNNALAALGSMNSGATAPSTTYANMLWYDTANNQLKIRNEDNDAFITLFTLNQTTDVVTSVEGVQLSVDTSPQLGGNLDTNGNDINFGDNDKAVFGAGSDLQIYHDGAQSIIDDAGTGELKIRSNILRTMKYTGETTALFTADGAVTLYYDNAEKLSTQPYGIKIGDNTAAVTNASWDTVQIGAMGFLSAFGTGGDATGLVVSSNAYLSTAGNWTYAATEQATKIDHVDGNIKFFSAPSGTAGTTISFTERFRMETDGDFHADGDVIAYSTTVSDQRLKSEIANIENALDKVGAINGVTFVRNHNGDKAAGVIAQEIMQVLPEAVKEKSLPLQTGSDDQYYVVEYDAVTGLLVEAVKELKARVEALEAK